MEVIGDFAFFCQGRKLLSLNIRNNEVKTHIGHSHEITSLVQSNSILYTGSLDGLIIKWVLPDYVSYKVNSPVTMMASSQSDLYFLKSNALILTRFELGSETFQTTPYFKGLLGDALDLKLTNSQTHLVLLKPLSIIILNISTQDSKVYEHNGPLSVMAIHPQDKYIAVGDVKGLIVKVYEKNNVKVHWHAHKVTCITFTNDSNYMLSGGEEGVIVLWHEASGDKNFLPRLGCSVQSVQVNQENDLYVVRLQDNSLKVFQTSDYKQIGGYIPLVNPGKIIPGSLAYTGLVWKDDRFALNASPGYIQLYHPETRKIDFFCCENRNPTLRSNEDYPTPLQVVSLSFNSDFTATLLVSDSIYMTVQVLKFWKGPKLNSLIMHPHFDTAHKVISYKDNFVTLGKSSFILWQYNEKWQGCAERTKDTQLCFDACALENLYVSFGSIITEWNDRMECVKEIFEPHNADVLYLQNTSEHLIAGTSENVHVYKKGLILWSLPLQFIHGIVSRNNTFLLGLNASKYTPQDLRIKNTNILMKFSIEKSVPLKIYKVDNPHCFTLNTDEEVIVIDKYFDYANLDKDEEFFYDEIPSYIKVANEGTGHKESKSNGLVGRYGQDRGLLWLGEFASHDLPGSDVFFSHIIEGNA